MTVQTEQNAMTSRKWNERLSYMRDWHSAEQGCLPEQGGRTAKILKERGTITEWQKNHL